MATDSATKAFVRFCQTGEPQALGRVFDQLAPELLLVAARLLPGGGDAADLVQQTFVTAMQQRRRFDPARAVTPWLVGILVQHVRRERRRLRRRIDPARLSVQPPEDPAAAVATLEDAEAVRRAVAAMPQPYRQVLQLHLVHGLPVAAVSASLERPFRTVQSQLRRGMQQLRRALPAVVVARWAGPGSLTAVRAHLLRAAASVWAGWWMLPWVKLAAALAIALLPCALIAASWALDGREESAAVTPPLLASALTPLVAERPGSSLGKSAPLQRVLLQDPAASSRVYFVVRSADDGAPLAGATLDVTVRERGADRSYSPAAPLPPVATDAEGKAVVEVPRGAGYLVDLTVRADGRQELWRQLYGTDRDEYRFEDVVLSRIAPGRVHVVDQHGAPVPFVDVFVNAQGTQAFRPRQAARSQTGDDGWTSEFPMPLGDVRIGLRRLPVDFAVGDDTEVRSRVTGGDCEIVLQRPAPETVVAGRVVDEQGDPIAGGWVQLLRARDGVPVALGHQLCDADGRFVVPVPPAAQGPFRVMGGVRQGSGQECDKTCERGDKEVLLRLLWPDGLALTVLDAKTGAPVEDFGVVCFRVHEENYGWISGDRDLRENGHHPGGVVFLDRLEPGANRLMVVPQGEEYLPCGYLPVRIAERGATKQQVRLDRPAPVAVHVAFGDGSPAHASRVLLLARLSADKNWTRLLPLPYGSSHWLGRLVLATATTDEHGVARLPWQPWREPVIVRAEGPGHQVAEVELAGVEPGGAAVEVRVSLGATVIGRVSGMDRLAELAVDPMGLPLPDKVSRVRPAVVLRNCADGELLEDPSGDAFPIGGDGRFVCRDVPPGRWQVLFQHLVMEQGYGSAIERIQRRPLAEVVTLVGREVETSFDLATVLPGSLSGSVFLDGVRVEAQQLTWMEWSVDHLGRPVRNGGFSSERFLQPDGTYRIGRLWPAEFDVVAEIDGRNYHLPERIAVAAGQQVQQDLQYRRLVARIRLLRANGKPLTDRLVRVGDDMFSLDHDGWFTVDPAPSSRFEVSVHPAGIDRAAMYQYRFDDPRVRRIPVGVVELVPGQPRSEHQLVLRED